MGDTNTKHIVVAGSTRKSGKTLLAQSLIARARAAGCSCGYAKLMRHSGHGFTVHPGPGPEGTDTFRCAASGAAPVVLVEYGVPEEIPFRLDGFFRHTDAVVWETNSGTSRVRPHVLVYLQGRAGHGKSPELAEEAFLVLSAPLEETLSEALCRRILNRAGMHIPGHDTPGVEGS